MDSEDFSEKLLKIKYEKKAKHKHIIFPELLSGHLSYFVGYLEGDGCLESNLKRISFTDKDLDHIKLINKLSISMFNVDGNIRERHPVLSKKAVYTLEIGSVDVHNFLRTVFDLPVGVKNNLRIPEIINKNKYCLMWYLRGLFDSDGTLPKNADTVKLPFIDITFKDKSFIEEIQNALLKFGVVTLKPYKRLAKYPNSDLISETWELRIRRRAVMIRFINEVGFFSKAKNDRAKRLLRRLNAAVAQLGYMRR